MIQDEIIFQDGQLDQDPSLYFVESGEIELYYDSFKGDQNKVIITHLTKGQSFGELAFIKNEPRNLNARASKNSNVMYI